MPPGPRHPDPRLSLFYQLLYSSNRSQGQERTRLAKLWHSINFEDGRKPFRVVQGIDAHVEQPGDRYGGTV